MSISTSVSPGQLALYQEASRLSGALKDYCTEMRPQLSSMEEDELSDCTERYTNALIRLSQLNDQVRGGKHIGCPSSEESEQEALRRSIRLDLDEAAKMEQPLRTALENKREELRGLIDQTQKKLILSAYLKAPLIGRNQALYDRKD